VVPGLADLFYEDGDYGYLPPSQAMFYGPDDRIVSLEDPETGLLRLLAPGGAPGQPTWGEPRWLAVSELAPSCGELLCLAAATGQERIAVCCTGGGLLVIDDPHGEPRSFTLSAGFRPFTGAALSRTGGLAAAVAGETLSVWQVATNAEVARVEVGIAENSYPPRVRFDAAASRVAVDREKRLVVYSLSLP